MRTTQLSAGCMNVSVKLHLKNKWTERHVRLSVKSARGVHPMGERSAMLRRNLKGGDKNPRSTNKYTNFGQLIIRKIIKIIATGCHV